MNIWVPKIYRDQHAILKVLYEYELTFVPMDIDEASLTISQISKLTGISFEEVFRYIIMLGNQKYISQFPNTDSYYSTQTGNRAYLSKSILYEGMQIRSQVFANYASGIGQIITIPIAIAALIISLTH